MPVVFRRFDDYLPYVSSDMLKPMVRLWGARAQPRKDECVAIIRRGLGDPDKVREAVAGLVPYERAALALVKWMGGTIGAGMLAAGLRASGVALPKTPIWAPHQIDPLIDALIRRGLLLTDNTPVQRYSYDPQGLAGRVFSDERLLAHIGPPEYVPLPIAPAAPPTASQARRPASAIMDIIRVLQAIDALGGIQLTKLGEPRAGDARKLLRAMGWNEESMLVDGLALSYPVTAFTSALTKANLLANTGDKLEVVQPLDRIARGSYAEPIGELLRGFIAAAAWSEVEAPTYSSYYGGYRAVGRMALAVALAALPDGDAFFALDDLERALFQRIGEHFTLTGPPAQPYLFNRTAEQIQQEQQQWRDRLRAGWLKDEKPWIAAAVASWLYFLGIVELGLVDGQPASARLTPLGRALLRGEEAEITAGAPAAGPAWRVQPNFEMIVYLDHARPDQIAFAERHAERVQSQTHTATYRLTRESIYQGLESGTPPDDLLAGLRDGAGGDLPQNVATSIREWAGQRERITMRRRASLLEFPDEAARRQMLAKGINGMPIGDRFILLTEPARELPNHERLDYEGALPACVTATENGTLTLTKSTGDLLVRPQLDRWAEPQPDGSWRLTAASVGAAIKAGGTLTQLTTLLKERLLRPAPPLLTVALRAWAGKPATVGVAKVTVLRCADPAAFAAIAGSSTFKPFLRGTLAPDTLLVDTRSVAALRERLAWAGLEVTETVEPPNR